MIAKRRAELIAEREKRRKEEVSKIYIYIF